METIVVPVTVERGRNIQKANSGPLSPTTFKSFDLREEHLENFIASYPELILKDRTAILVGRQVSNEQKSRADLIALDSDGSIIVIEIKRDMDDCKARAEKFEMQAIRYAATYSRIRSIEELAEQVYVPYLKKFEPTKITGKVEDYAKSEINRVLRSGTGSIDFNAKQKIILVASDFDKEVLSACAWLVQNGIDISCIRLSPLEYGEQPLILIEQVLPPLALEEMLTPIAKQNLMEAEEEGNGSDTRKSRTTLPTLATLFEQNLISAGDEVRIKGRPEQMAKAIDHKLVQYNGDSLPWNEWAKRVTEWSAVNIYANVELVKNGKTLDDLRWGK